jgi:rSAM/selenodomain-associated transferase 1
MHGNLLMVFAKNPVRGKVKTRLAEETGIETALNIYRDLYEMTFAVTADANWETQAWFEGGIPGDFHLQHPGVEVHFQPAGDLGEKMNSAFEKNFRKGYGKIIVIGTDCPGVSSFVINDAFSMLDHSEVVIGPAKDGGYYLLGLRIGFQEIFTGMPWSSENLLFKTLEAIRRKGKTFFLLSSLSDIDTLKDLEEYPGLWEKWKGRI